MSNGARYDITRLDERWRKRQGLPATSAYTNYTTRTRAPTWEQRGYQRLPAPTFTAALGRDDAAERLKTGARFGGAAAKGGAFGAATPAGAGVTGSMSGRVLGQPAYPHSRFSTGQSKFIRGGFTGMGSTPGQTPLADVRMRPMETGQDRISGYAKTTALGTSRASNALESLTRQLQSSVQSEANQARQMLNKAWTTIENMGLDPEDREALGTAMHALLENPTLSDQELQAEIQRGVEQISAETGSQLDILAAEGGPGARQKRWDILEKGTGARIKHERETRLEYAKRLGQERRADYATATQISQTLAEADRNKVQAMLSATGATLDVGDYGRQILGGALEALTTYSASFDPSAAAQAIASGVGVGSPRVTYSRMRRG